MGDGAPAPDGQLRACRLPGGDDAERLKVDAPERQ